MGHRVTMYYKTFSGSEILIQFPTAAKKRCQGKFPPKVEIFIPCDSLTYTFMHYARQRRKTKSRCMYNSGMVHFKFEQYLAFSVTEIFGKLKWSSSTEKGIYVTTC